MVAFYQGLQLAQSHLAHERYVDEATMRVRNLEAEVDELQKRRQQASTNITPYPYGTRWWQIWPK